MINKEDIKVGNRFACSFLLHGEDALITKVEELGFYYLDKDINNPVFCPIDAAMGCNTCEIIKSAGDLQITINSKNRFALISDSFEKELEVTKHYTNPVVNEFKLELEDLGSNNIPAEIRNLKDQLFNKVKLHASHVQSKKDIASSWRETISQVKEEIDALITKISSLEDQLKINNAKV